MSFFILVKNSVHKFDFSYLSDQKERDLDDTQVGPGREKLHRFDNNHQGAMVLAKDLMATGIKYLSENDTALTARKIMLRLNIHHVPVARNGKIAGLVSSTDIHGVEDDILLQDEKLKLIMGKTVLCVSESTPLQHIVEVFVNEYVHCLPVINEEQKMVGIITQTDVFKWMLANGKCKS